MVAKVEPWRNRIVGEGEQVASRLCACGCGRQVARPDHKYFKGHRQAPGAPSVNDMLPAICLYCGAPLVVHRWRIDKFGERLFCSRAHAKAQRSLEALETFACEHCGAEVTMRGSRKQGEHRFCSTDCAYAYRDAHAGVTVRCDGCGVEYQVSPSVAQRNGHFYCSRACRARAIMGANNPAYRSGWGRAREYAANWKSQRAATVARDGGRCQRCGKEAFGQNLHVHHIRPAYLFDGDWERANDLANLVTLCARCHKAAEKETAPIAQLTICTGRSVGEAGA